MNVDHSALFQWLKTSLHMVLRRHLLSGKCVLVMPTPYICCSSSKGEGQLVHLHLAFHWATGIAQQSQKHRLLNFRLGIHPWSAVVYAHAAVHCCCLCLLVKRLMLTQLHLLQQQGLVLRHQQLDLTLPSQWHLPVSHVDPGLNVPLTKALVTLRVRIAFSVSLAAILADVLFTGNTIQTRSKEYEQEPLEMIAFLF